MNSVVRWEYFWVIYTYSFINFRESLKYITTWNSLCKLLTITVKFIHECSPKPMFEHCSCNSYCKQINSEQFFIDCTIDYNQSMVGNRFLSMLSNRVNIWTSRVSVLGARSRTTIVSRFTPAPAPPFESRALVENAIKKSIRYTDCI